MRWWVNDPVDECVTYQLKYNKNLRGKRTSEGEGFRVFFLNNFLPLVNMFMAYLSFA